MRTRYVPGARSRCAVDTDGFDADALTPTSYDTAVALVPLMTWARKPLPDASPPRVSSRLSVVAADSVKEYSSTSPGSSIVLVVAGEPGTMTGAVPSGVASMRVAKSR